MTWLAANWKIVFVAGLIGWTVFVLKLAIGYHARATSAEKSLASSEAITRNATAAINLMYDITKAANAERQSLQQKGETHVVYIREAVKGDECAIRDVPAAAADDIRMYADSIRSGASAKAKP